MKSDDLIMGIYNYTNPQLKTSRGGIEFFVKSLRKHNKSCRVVVIINNIPDEFKKLFEKYHIETVKPHHTASRYELMYRRFFTVMEYIEQNPQIKNILLCDIEDLVFQDDPFSIPLSDHIYYDEENSPAFDNKIHRLALPVTSRVNKRWIWSAHQKSTSLPKLDWSLYSGRNYVCAGTILGNRQAIIDYLEWYTNIQYLKTDGSWINSLDQGLYNIYTHEIIKAVPTHYQTGRILTMSNINRNELKTDPHERFINDEGIPYAILHQYDRFFPKSPTEMYQFLSKYI
jgi:hypothetical protein